MDRTAFEDKLRADGFTEIAARKLEAGPANGEHGHPFTARGLILDGAFTITLEGTPRTYRSGEVFEVTAGRKHCEQVGPDGAHVLVGRKYTQA